MKIREGRIEVWGGETGDLVPRSITITSVVKNNAAPSKE